MKSMYINIYFYIPTLKDAYFYLSSLYRRQKAIKKYKLKFFEIKDTISSFKCLFYIVLFARQQKRIYNIQKKLRECFFLTL